MNETPGLTATGIKAIIFYAGMPKLVEVTSVTGKRAKIRRPGSPMNSEIRSVPMGDLYAFNEEIWLALESRVEKIRIIKEKMNELSGQLEPLARVLGKKAGGVDDDFWS